MFKILSDLTEIGQQIWKGLQEDWGTEQLQKPEFLRKPKEKKPQTNNTTKTHTLESIGRAGLQSGVLL